MQRFGLGLLPPEGIAQGGGEIPVGQQHQSPWLTDRQPKVKSLANTALTEMRHNAMDHSDAQRQLGVTAC